MIRKIVIGSLFALAAITGVYVRFANPELTETQLIIQFWYVWLFIPVVMFIEMWLFKGKKKDKVEPVWPFKVTK